MEGLTTNTDDLKGRVDRFLTSGSRGAEACAMINHLSAVGQVGIFGGMLRDIARAGSDAFSSDIDLVVDGPTEKLTELFRDASAKRNRFGGYRVYGHRTQFDVWSLQDTWAIKEGFVSGSSLADLTKTTFFDWDAAVYLPHSKILYSCEGYLDRLRSGVVTINLEPNPNPLGAVARTLRLLLDWQVGLSNELVEFLWKNLSVYDRNQVVDAQRETIGRVPLRSRSISRLRRKLATRDFFESAFWYDHPQINAASRIDHHSATASANIARGERSDTRDSSRR